LSNRITDWARGARRKDTGLARPGHCPAIKGRAGQRPGLVSLRAMMALVRP